jgi:hypothetical protein
MTRWTLGCRSLARTLRPLPRVFDSGIGSRLPRTDRDDNLVCKHGPSECLGNIISLCAAYLYPNSTEISLGFVNCLVSSYERIPSRPLVEHCALEHGVDFEKLNHCASGQDEKAIDMLKKSFERSRRKGVTYSCTVRLDDKIRCIRDNGRWKNCKGGSKVEDLVKEVDDLYERFNGGS